MKESNKKYSVCICKLPLKSVQLVFKSLSYPEKRISNKKKEYIRKQESKKEWIKKKQECFPN